MDGKVSLDKMGVEKSERTVEGEARVGEGGREGGGWFNWEQSRAEQERQTAADVREQEGSEEEDEKQGNI